MTHQCTHYSSGTNQGISELQRLLTLMTGCPYGAIDEFTWTPHDKTNKMTGAPSKDSDQSGHLVSLIRVFAVHSVGSWGPKVSSCGQQRLWSDWVDVQADLSLRWVHRSFCWFCHAAAHIIPVIGYCPVILIAVMILHIDTDILTKQIDQSLHYFPFQLHLLDRQLLLFVWV